MEYNIKHNASEHKFEAVSEGNTIGLIDYSFSNDNTTMIVTHTEVNSEFAGLGIAGALTKELLIYVQKQNLKILPICTYTKTYIERHQEYNYLIV